MRSEVDSIQTIRVFLMKESQENVIHEQKCAEV